MAPLTLNEKYDDLVRCADQPLSSYERLTNEDLEDIISKSWPFIIESITYTSLSTEKNNSIEFNNEVHIKLERRLKIQFQLYSEAAKRCEQKFPNRKPIRRNRNYIDSSAFENISEMNIPDFHVFCALEHPNDNNQQQQQKEYDHIITTIETSPYRMLIFKQALKECCRCGNYDHLKRLCLAVDISLEKIYFDNNNTVLHESIKLNNKQLTNELIQLKFNINVDGELGTPLVTAIHYDILWAVELLLNNGADLTKHHIDWPFLTLYEYCIEFAKINIKIIIDKYITSLVRKHKYSVIHKLIDNGWNISFKQKMIYKYNINHIK